jgi:hypothetical protein
VVYHVVRGLVHASSTRAKTPTNQLNNASNGIGNGDGNGGGTNNGNRLLPPSMLNIYKVFEPIDMLSIGIW